MTGFPSRVSRDTFGPTLRNAWAVENPEIHIPAEAFNTAFHQLAGMNVAHPVRAIVVAEYDGVSAMTVSYRAEAWNSKGDQVHPVVARTGAGVYTVTFAASYLNELGASVPTSLLYAKAQSLEKVAAWSDKREAHAWIDVTNPLIVNVTTWDPASGTAADAKFLLEVA
jgi:hypothetical protein